MIDFFNYPCYNYIINKKKGNEMGKVFALCSQKGGTAKTSSAIEIAACLTNEGYKVLLIDLDQQCDSSRNSGIKSPEYTIHDIFQQECKIADAIYSVEWYDIIPASPILSKADKTYMERDDIYLLKDVCEILLKKYDFIIIDNPPARNVLLNMTYIAADYIICPTLSDDNSIRGIIAVEQDLKKLRDSRNKESHAYIIGIILAIYESTNSHKKAFENLQKITEALPGDVFVSTVRKTIKMAEIKTLCMPLQAYEKFNNASLDYKKIAKRIIDIYEEDLDG